MSDNRGTEGNKGPVITEELALACLKSNYKKAESVVKDPDKVEDCLRRAENKLKQIPTVGPALSKIPLLISLVRKYIRREYTTVPIGTIVAVIAAILYFISPIDLLPDILPGIGYLDDAAVIGLCVKMIAKDLEDYETWRIKNSVVIEVG